MSTINQFFCGYQQKSPHRFGAFADNRTSVLLYKKTAGANCVSRKAAQILRPRMNNVRPCRILL